MLRRLVEFGFIQIRDDQPGAVARETLAIARPMPLAAPVTTATLFFNFLSMPTLPSQNDADAPLGAKTFAVQKAALFLDLECAVARHQTIPVAAEIVSVTPSLVR